MATNVRRPSEEPPNPSPWTRLGTAPDVTLDRLVSIFVRQSGSTPASPSTKTR